MNLESLVAETCQRFEEKFPGGSDPYVGRIYLESFLESISDTLASGEPVTIRGLGTISAAEFSARRYSAANTKSQRLTERRVFRFVPEREEQEMEDENNVDSGALQSPF